MSTITKSTSLPRPYIGSRRNRHYHASSLSNDYFFSNISSLKSEEENNLSKTQTTSDAIQVHQEDKIPIEYFSSTTLLDERHQQLPQLQSERQKAKDFLSSSPSLFLFPTTHNAVEPLSGCCFSSPPSSASSLVTEKQKLAHHHHHHHHQNEQESFWQPSNSENKNNQPLPGQVVQHQQQQQEHNRPSSISNHPLDLSNLPEENNSLSSCSFNSTTLVNDDNDNQFHALTSTPILPPTPHHLPTASNNVFSLISTNNNKPSQSSDTVTDQSSTISTVGLITALQREADIWQLNNMSSSSMRYSSGFVTGANAPYDQRITDQGNKYVIQLKTDDFQEQEFIITQRISLNQLIVDAKHHEEDTTGGYVHRELHKIFLIPKHIDLSRPSHSYNRQNHELTVEMPYLQTTNSNEKNDSSYIPPVRTTTDPLTFSYTNLNRNGTGTRLSSGSTRPDYHSDSNNTSGIGTAANNSTLMRSTGSAYEAPVTKVATSSTTKPFDFDIFHRSAFRPQIIRTTTNENNNEKKLVMNLDLSDYQAEDIKVSIKDRDLIVQAEKKIETDTRKSRASFFQSTSLPPQTDIDHLQSNYIDGKLIIEAPYLDQQNAVDRRITTTASTSNHGTGWQTVAESQQKSIINDPFQQRTETTIEFLRRRRL